jgi:DNA-binding CsgD family transcriptional regulator
VKPLAPDELLARVRRLVRSTMPVAPAVASRLTARETEVLRLLAEGCEPAEIAKQLFISRRTVGTHLENIMRKLGVRSRAQAVALAYREELVNISDL